jgi:hypothetical protein
LIVKKFKCYKSTLKKRIYKILLLKVRLSSVKTRLLILLCLNIEGGKIGKLRLNIDLILLLFPQKMVLK